MTIDELQILINNARININEYIEKLILIFFDQIPDDMLLGDIIFLFILGLLVLSIIFSALSTIIFDKKVGLESYYLDQTAIRSKKINADGGAQRKWQIWPNLYINNNYIIIIAIRLLYVLLTFILLYCSICIGWFCLLKFL